MPTFFKYRPKLRHLLFFVIGLLLIHEGVVFFRPAAVPVHIQTIPESLSLSLDVQPTAAKQVIQTKQFQHQKEYISDIKTTQFPFGALNIQWEEDTPPNTNITLFVKFLENNKWTEWVPINKDEDDKDPLGKADKINTSLLITNHATAFQYKANLESQDSQFTPVLKKVTFTYFNAEDKTPILEKSLLASLEVLLTKKSKIISRKKWGADESLRIFKGDLKNGTPLELLRAKDKEFYEKFKDELIISKVVETNKKGDYLTWPIEYAGKIKKIIIHHTATVKDLDNPAEAIRNIYYYHAMTRGWGDIGYNYIIDPKGNIYEGRSGGAKAVGAHASEFNQGSIGIAVLGDYSANQIPLPALQSLLELVGQKAKKYHISPNGASTFRGQKIKNILGHRDVGETTCPGDKLYPEITYIRKLLAFDKVNANIKDEKTAEDFSFYETSTRSIMALTPEKTNQVAIKLKNTGKTVWNNQTRLVITPVTDSNDMIMIGDFKKTDPLAIPFQEKQVKRGKIGTFIVPVTAGIKSGLINFEATPLFNGQTSTKQKILLPFYIESPDVSYEVADTNYPKKVVAKGEKITGWVELKNTGAITWKNTGPHAIFLGTDRPRDRVSQLLASNRPGRLVQIEVAPGQIGRFEITFNSPNRGGRFIEYLTPVIEGITWLQDKNISFQVIIEGNEYKSQFIDRKNTIFEPGETKKVWLKIKNTGDVIWPEQSAKLLPIKHPEIELPANLVAAGIVEPDQIVQFDFSLTAPKTEGNYKVYFWPQVGDKKLSDTAYYYEVKVKSKAQKDAIEKKGGLIRILLSFSGQPVIGGNGSFILYQGDNKVREYTIDETLEVSYEHNQYVIKDTDQALLLTDVPRFIPKDNTILAIKNFERPAPASSDQKDNEYRGALEVRFIDNKLQVINELPMEDYLQGMAEEPNDTPYEKLKVMAVLARSYAKYHRDRGTKFPGKPYDGSDDPAIFQKYIGYSYEKRAPNIVKAVNETHGLVVTYQGKQVITPYFSQSDGRTRSAEEIWGWKDTPYLQSVADPYCQGKELRGHGVGLSGCGAYGAALAGKTYQEIIKYYYQGVEVEKVY